LHRASTSLCYSQYHLPSFLLQTLFPTLEHPAPVPSAEVQHQWLAT
jgi:hypothetical protein